MRLSTQQSECRQSPPGFTLLEVMVALSVVAVVLLALHKLNGQTIQLAQETDFHAVAALLAQKKMAEIESALPELPTARSGDFGQDQPGYRWELSVEGVGGEQLGEVGEDFRRIDLVVSEEAQGRSFRLRTYRLVR
ncbi:MAG: prepilin-type N-terminal cleavage/methylation domain-containing protein [Desulfobacteraceae bacterium]|nr:prepilin-type N-terminal cleavage/methylation domain-containing protein [Desulfobacteraceae bacterium]